MLSLAFPGSPLAGAYPLSRGYSCATIASRLRLRTLPYVVNRIPQPRHAVEGSKITIESVSKASERLWFRLHTAPWFKPFRSAGVLLLGKTTQGLFAIVYTELAARALGLAAFGALVLLHGLLIHVAALVCFQSWHICVENGGRV